MRKSMRKRITLGLIMCMLFALLAACPAYADEPEGKKLTARADGSYHILLVADTQDTEKPQQTMLDLLNAELDAADPDLVIFLGDMIYGPYVSEGNENVAKAIDAIIEPVVERNIPFAVTFGNHDDQECLSKEEQLAIYQSYPGCLNDDPDIPGVGNTCLQLCTADSETPSALLWLMDSGTYAPEEIGGYGYVEEEQNEWFREGVAVYGEDRPVSYVFQHIPVPQVRTLIEPARAFQKNAFCTYGNPFSDWYTEKEGAIREGHFGEAPCPPDYDSGQFDSWKDCGVKAAFFGHDHTNDYIATVEGIDLVSTCGIGFYSYGRGDEHGARLLVLHADKPDEYETKMVFYKDLFDKKLSLFQTPHIGMQLAKIVVPAIAGLILLIIVLIILIKKLRKRRRRKKNGC